ncbi:MAG: flagellar hook-basal body complex protein FliE [Rhizobiales bacterium]|nr:flagellar hook-basal body complex protein FliE [Hyphomicrobiales bacterium]
MPSPLAAANAYASLAKIGTQSTGGSNLASGLAKGGGSFGDMLKEAVGSVLQSGRKSDAQMQSLAAGKANVVDVVTAVAETEVAVGTLVSVRDKVIQSYEEIMRMPI